jgi:uncharacterized protein (TIGR03083 family)
MIDTRPLFPVERQRLLDLLGDLDLADWQRPTVCPGWSVHDIAGHIVHDYLRRLSGGRDGHQGVWLPAHDLPRALARVNEAFVGQTRLLSPRVLTDLIAHFGPQVDALWESLDLAAIGRNDIWWAGPGVPAPIWLDVAREYTEFWVHQQQIRDAVGRPGADDPGLMRPVIDTFLRAMPHTLRDVTADIGTALRIRVDGPAGGTWMVTRDRQRWAMAGQPDPGLTTTLDTDPGTIWRLATGAITADAAREVIAVDGDLALAAAALAIVAIIR